MYILNKKLHIFQLEVAEQLKKRGATEHPVQKKADAAGKMNPAVISVQQHLAQRQVLPMIPPMPPSSLDKPKRKKTKIISTGAGRAINPKSRLYCVCKQPYDETK